MFGSNVKYIAIKKSYSGVEPRAYLKSLNTGITNDEPSP
jgi:hypothetical protein